ncbi:MAG TPA: hypothetical protein VIX61_04485 [Casimicrobiaceae bacterium]
MAPRLSVRATWRQPAWPAEHAARRSPRVAAGAAASAGDAPLARLANAAGFCAALALGGIGALRERAAPQFEFRALAPWPAPKFLRTFPGEFERAFGDRFGGRGALLLLHHRAMVGVFGVSPAPNVMIGRDGWLYFLGEEGQALDRHYRGRSATPRSRPWPSSSSGASGSWRRAAFYACAKPGLPRAVVYRDSMAIPLIPLLSENFSRAVYVGSRRLDPALILREAPDVVIEEMVERSLQAPAALPMPEAK